MNCAVIQQMVNLNGVFKTSFWGMYQLDSDGPVLLLPDIDSDYLELQLYTREPYMAAADTIWVDDDL